MMEGDIKVDYVEDVSDTDNDGELTIDFSSNDSSQHQAVIIPDYFQNILQSFKS